MGGYGRHAREPCSFDSNTRVPWLPLWLAVNLARGTKLQCLDTAAVQLASAAATANYAPMA